MRTNCVSEPTSLAYYAVYLQPSLQPYSPSEPPSPNNRWHNLPAVKLRRQGWMEVSLHRIAIDSRDETSKAVGDGDSGGFTNRPRRFTHLRNCVPRQDFWKASDNILVSLVCFAIFQPASWRFSVDVKECRRAQRDPCGVLFCASFITLLFYVEELMAANFLKSIFIFSCRCSSVAQYRICLPINKSYPCFLLISG